MPIVEYFLEMKILCAKISELDEDEPMSEARLRQYLILG